MAKEAKMNLSKMLMAIVIVLLPCAASAQPSDAAYCQALAAKYKMFFVTDGGHYRDNGPIDGNIAADQCRAGNTAGIPVLERKLRDAKIELPARG
jgi:hypothetical protein